MQRLIDELIRENTFLTETITLHKLGEIVADRRNIQAQMEAVKSQANSELSEAANIRSLYEQELYNIETIKKRLLNKENDINEYIRIEATKQIATENEKLNQERKCCQELLQKHINENDDILRLKISLYKKRRKRWIVLVFTSLIIATLSLLTKIL